MPRCASATRRFSRTISSLFVGTRVAHDVRMSRQTRVLALAALLFPAVHGCNTGSRPAPVGTDVTFTDAAYCDVARLPGLVDWSGGVATACPSLEPSEVDPDGIDGSSCRVWIADGSGELVETDIGDVRAAQGIGDGTIVAWGWDGSLTVHEPGRASREIAAVAADPWIDYDDGTVAFIAPLPGYDTLEPGDDRRVMRIDLRSGEELDLVTDATASSPVPVPGSSDVLYVSAATGVAQIVLVGPEEITPLTNVGLEEVGMGFVPVYGRELVFTDGGHRLVFAADYEIDTIWSLDLRTGDVEELGPGRFPALATDGTVLAQNESSADASCAVRYLDGSAP